MKRSWLAFGVATLVWSPIASAQAPSAADRETARALLNDGDAAFAGTRYADALRAYREADGIMHVPTTGAEVAKAHEALGQLVEAKEACRLVLAYPHEPSEPKPFATARERCTTLSQSLSERIPSVTIRVSGVVAPATPRMTIDGEPVVVASSEVRRRVNPGTHRVVVTAPGYEEAARSFTIAERATDEVEVTMRGSTVATDGPRPQEGGVAPAPTPARDSAPVPLYAKVALGVGGVGLGVGAITGLMALARVNTAKKLCVGNDCDPAAAGDIDAANTLSHVSTVGFALGVVGAGVGLYGIFARGPASTNAASRGGSTVHAYFTGTGGGLAGSF